MKLRGVTSTGIQIPDESLNYLALRHQETDPVALSSETFCDDGYVL